MGVFSGLQAIPALRQRLALWISRRVYYGWVIIGVVFLANLGAFNLSPTLGLYIAPLELEFGWSRGEISRSLTAGTVMGALIAPHIGYLADRLGVRALNIGLGVLTALFLVLLLEVGQAWQFNLAFGAAFAFGTTGIGQLLGGVAVSRWFVRRRGRAMGVVMMGASAGALVFVPLNTWVIEAAGWRWAIGLQAAACLALVSIPSWLLLVESPEQLGIHNPREFSRGAGGQQEEHSWQLHQALKTPVFWLTLGGVILANFCVLGYFVHAVPIMQSNGASRTVASAAWTVFFFFGVIAKFFWGFLIERIGVRLSLVLLFIGEALGMIALFYAIAPAHWFAYAIFNALAHGPFLQLMSMVWPDLFGRAHLGRIMGATQPAVIISGSLGPWVAGIMFDHTQRYDAFLILAIGIALLTAIVFATCRRPEHPPQK